MLYLVATPIGNLEDITKRALRVLEECDAILCEDTRRSSILLQKYGIRKPLLSYHQFKEKQLLSSILQRLQSGQNLALLSDAGTPCINDPGLLLVQACVAHGVPFTALPGPCSVIQALLLSGFETERFQFLGFLPRKPEKTLCSALRYPGTTICFESPERLVATLRTLERLDGNRKVAVVREMTKTFEECVRGMPREVLERFEKEAPRGEIVLVLAPGVVPEELPMEELIVMLQELHGLSLREAIKAAAKLLKVPKRAVYKQTLESVAKVACPGKPDDFGASCQSQLAGSSLVDEALPGG